MVKGPRTRFEVLDDGSPSAPEPQDKEKPVSQVGIALREARLAAGKDVKDVAEYLRIRVPYIESIEEGRLSDLPGPAYAVGFVRALAEHLGLDGREVTRLFKEEVSSLYNLNQTTQLDFPAPMSQGHLPKTPLVLIAIVAAAVFYAGWYFLENRGQLPDERVALPPAGVGVPVTENEPASENAPAPENEKAGGDKVGGQGAGEKSEPETEPAVAAPGMDKPSAVETPPKLKPAVAVPPVPKVETPATPSKPTEAAPPPVVAKTGSRVTLRASEESWIEVRDSTGAVMFSQVLRGGDTYTVPDLPGMTLLTGNAGALQVLVDGVAVPPIGGQGQVRRDISLDPDKLTAGN